MNRLILIGMAVSGLLITSCNKTDKAEDCIHCTGCFSSWDECESEYRPTEADPMTWEEHKNYMITNPSGATWYCEQAQ